MNMPSIAKPAFGPREARAAQVAKALAHPARIAILKTLARRGVCVCGEIVEVLPLAQSTVSQHLKELREAGLIRGETDGPKSCYCIDWKTLGALRDVLRGLFDGLEKDRKRSCC